MLYSFSKHISHCNFRAAECRELAALSISATARQLYVEREQAWLALARSYEFSGHLGRMFKDMQGWTEHDDLPPTRNIWMAISPPKCPSCAVEMQFHASQPAMRRFTQTRTMFERSFFLCPNCRRLGDRLVVIARA